MNELLERFWPMPSRIKVDGEFARPTSLRFTGVQCPERYLQDFVDIAQLKINSCDEAYEIRLSLGAELDNNEGYALELTADGASLVASDNAGLAYGLETLLQISTYFTKVWPISKIDDQPSFKKRCFMVDMGRSIFSLDYLKRIVRILARLKMNQLHLHLYDDEICSIRFDDLPFGSENPYAINLSQLKELVDYASGYNVEIVPELEAWGHAGSIVYHRPDLRGGRGMYSGSSFLICQETFDLIRTFVRQVASCLPDQAIIHLGLDEAQWHPGNDMPSDYTPSDMVGEYYRIVKEVGAELNKDLTLRVWADHAGRPIAEEIRNKIIIEPWNYWDSNQDKMIKDTETYSGEDKAPWMVGAGVSGAQFRGAYHATRFWSKIAAESPNVEGVNITFWCWNDLDRKLISLFAGSYFLWNPYSNASFVETENYEDFDRIVYPIMFDWQALFKDADPDAMAEDRGPIVWNGFYHFGGRHLEPAAPSAPAAKTGQAHDYLNEHKD